jgi:hypothetical protein
MSSAMESGLLAEKQAASALGLRACTARVLAQKADRFPPYVRVGPKRIFYDRRDLDAGFRRGASRTRAARRLSQLAPIGAITLRGARAMDHCLDAKALFEDPPVLARGGGRF